MEYNTQYLDLHYSLINAFMIGAEPNILDISYEKKERTIHIQIVLLDGTNLPEQRKRKVTQALPDYVIEIHQLHLAKEKFNESKGEWPPNYYTWLKHLLFTKAEQL